MADRKVKNKIVLRKKTKPVTTAKSVDETNNNPLAGPGGGEDLAYLIGTPCDWCGESRYGGRNDRGGGRYGDRGPREMHDATCGDCGNECKIPFAPKDGRPVYCNECFPNHRNQRRD